MDVVVVGGSAGAVAAAAAAAEQGAKVFLAAPRHYLGEDICGTLRLWREPGEEFAAPLASRLYPSGKPATPLQVKKTLDDALLAAKVEFLFGCFPSDVLVDERGTPCGVVMANRAGRQAVRAKVIVDATHQATVARLAGAKSRPWPAGPVTFRRVVIGGQAPSSPDVAQRKPPTPPVTGNARGAKKGTTAEFETVEYTMRLPLANAGFAAWAEAERRRTRVSWSTGSGVNWRMLLRLKMMSRMSGIA